MITNLANNLLTREVEAEAISRGRRATDLLSLTHPNKQL